jgi:hypothetical protein
MSMAKLTNNYPHGLSDKEIMECISGYSKEIFDNRQELPSALVQYAPLIQLGASELQGRQTKRATNLSIFVSIISLSIAGAALGVSYYSSKSSSRWEESQIKALNEIKSEVTKISIDTNQSINNSSKLNLTETRESTNKIVLAIEKLQTKTANKSK